MGFAPLDPVLHNQLRLAVMSLLVAVEEGDFNFLLEKTGATRGNLSVQITKLKEAGYINVKKTFKNNYPNTVCSITHKGLKAFELYVKAIKDYLNTP
ncbi:MAG: transcriptional regulator [Flavobacteriales bacterium]|nr:transcriptional regulator [Flavobacteriales bacterium]MBK9286703.1 transcriptional regulator [Flavobacteriales bacterium]